jgi:hypothetical protein
MMMARVMAGVLPTTGAAETTPSFPRGVPFVARISLSAATRLE